MQSLFLWGLGIKNLWFSCVFRVCEMGKPYFWQMFSFHIPWKHQKIKGFLMFSGGVEMEHIFQKFSGVEVV